MIELIKGARAIGAGAVVGLQAHFQQLGIGIVEAERHRHRFLDGAHRFGEIVVVGHPERTDGDVEIAGAALHLAHRQRLDAGDVVVVDQHAGGLEARIDAVADNDEIEAVAYLSRCSPPLGFLETDIVEEGLLESAARAQLDIAAALRELARPRPHLLRGENLAHADAGGIANLLEAISR